MAKLLAWNEVPEGAVITTPGNSIEYKTGTWRVFRPEIDYSKCVRCGFCWLYCPEAAIKEEDGKYVIDYDYCKGCGICSRVCPRKAIEMKVEVSE